MQYNIAVIKGDGIGPEIVTEAMKAMEVVGEKFGHTFNFTEYGMGGSDPDTGDPVLTPITLTVTVDDFVDVADKEIEVK